MHWFPVCYTVVSLIHLLLFIMFTKLKNQKKIVKYIFTLISFVSIFGLALLWQELMIILLILLFILILLCTIHLENIYPIIGIILSIIGLVIPWVFYVPTRRVFAPLPSGNINSLAIPFPDALQTTPPSIRNLLNQRTQTTPTEIISGLRKEKTAPSKSSSEPYIDVKEISAKLAFDISKKEANKWPYIWMMNKFQTRAILCKKGEIGKKYENYILETESNLELLRQTYPDKFNQIMKCKELAKKLTSDPHETQWNDFRDVAFIEINEDQYDILSGPKQTKPEPKKPKPVRTKKDLFLHFYAKPDYSSDDEIMAWGMRPYKNMEQLKKIAKRWIDVQPPNKLIFKFSKDQTIDLKNKKGMIVTKFEDFEHNADVDIFPKEAIQLATGSSESSGSSGSLDS